MVEKFHVELKNLKEDVKKMGELAKEMLRKGVLALKDQDEKMADCVISKKPEMNKYDRDIEAKALQLLTLYQPMAVDMRTLATILKLITYLNRIGMYGKDIAKIAKELAKTVPIAKLVSIPYMAEIVCSMIDDSFKAFETSGLKTLDTLIEREEAVDSLRYSIFRECMTYMIEDPKTIVQCMNYTMVARYLERCGDHALKMAEKINYMVTGEHKEFG